MFFLVDKPVGISSFFAVAMVRKAVGAKKAGHTGTLDPLASGLLVVATEGSTKLIPFLENDRKTYEFSVDFSVRSDSLDLGTPTEPMDSDALERAATEITEAAVRGAAERFVGTTRQVPPKYSALRIDGKRAYNLARRDREFDLPSREVRIFRLELRSFRFPVATFETEVSAGTYVRSLARDM